MDAFYDIFWNLYFGNSEYFSENELAKISRVVGDPEEFGYAYGGYGYQKTYVSDTDKDAKAYEHTEGKMFFCCASLVSWILGGATSAPGRASAGGKLIFEEDDNKLLNSVKPRYELFYGEQDKYGHVGIVVLYDFGSGYETSVFQSASKSPINGINGKDIGPTISGISTNANAYREVNLGTTFAGKTPQQIYYDAPIHWIEATRNGGDNCYMVPTPNRGHH